jgi:cell division protein FtsQ
MARRASAELAMPLQGNPGRSFVRYFLAGVMALLVAVLVMVTLSRVEQFLIADTRFHLPPMPEPGTSSPFFEVEGIHYTSEQQVQQVFARDFGRSLYLCPIADRRRLLMGVDWVKDASVSRIWPNKLLVRITERTPVAYAQVTTGRVNQFLLIDEDGVFLDPRKTGNVHLPVVTGIPMNEPEAQRKVRVRRFLRLKSDLDPLMDKISEIDVADADNLKLSATFEHRSLTLMIGNQDFQTRFQNFLNNIPEIRRRAPGATMFDLRIKGSVLAVGGGNVE